MIGPISVCWPIVAPTRCSDVAYWRLGGGIWLRHARPQRGGFMKRSALVLLLMLVTADASAISSYDRVHAIIASEGAAILRYRGRTGVTLYDRYVFDRRYCPSSQTTETVSVP